MKLAIEIDWDSHNYSWDNDEQRTKKLNSFWIKVIRYTNIDINKNLDWVILDIKEQIKIREVEFNWFL